MRGTGCEAAHQAFLEGKYAFSVSSRDALEDSRRCFAQAAGLDPGFARAWSALSYTYVQASLQGWSGDAGADMATAGTLARRGAELAPDDYFTRWHLAFYLLNSKQVEGAIAEYETALSLSEESQDLLVEMAEALICAGRLEDGIALIERARRTADWSRWDDALLRCVSALNGASGYDDAVADLARMHRKPGDPRGLIDVQLLAAAVKGPGAAVPFYERVNGHVQNGHAYAEGANGHAGNGHGTNGHGTNGLPTNGHGNGLPAPNGSNGSGKAPASEWPTLKPGASRARGLAFDRRLGVQPAE
jgi:tetratricopeptide (TPR) repeat protein